MRASPLPGRRASGQALAPTYPLDRFRAAARRAGDARFFAVFAFVALPNTAARVGAVNRRTAHRVSVRSDAAIIRSLASAGHRAEAGGELPQQHVRHAFHAPLALQLVQHVHDDTFRPFLAVVSSTVVILAALTLECVATGTPPPAAPARRQARRRT